MMMMMMMTIVMMVITMVPLTMTMLNTIYDEYYDHDHHCDYEDCDDYYYYGYEVYGNMMPMTTYAVVSVLIVVIDRSYC